MEKQQQTNTYNSQCISPVKHKVACLVHQSLSRSGIAPEYLAEDVNFVADIGSRLLQSAADRTCIFPCTHNKVGDNCTAIRGVDELSAVSLTRGEDERTYKYLENSSDNCKTFVSVSHLKMLNVKN